MALTIMTATEIVPWYRLYICTEQEKMWKKMWRKNVIESWGIYYNLLCLHLRESSSAGPRMFCVLYEVFYYFRDQSVWVIFPSFRNASYLIKNILLLLNLSSFREGANARVLQWANSLSSLGFPVQSCY